MVELPSSVPYSLDNTPFIFQNFIHVIKPIIYVIFVEILMFFFPHLPYKSTITFQYNYLQTKLFLQLKTDIQYNCQI